MNCPKCGKQLEPVGVILTVHMCNECRFLTTADCTGCGYCCTKYKEGRS